MGCDVAGAELPESPELLFSLAVAYWGSCALFAGIELGLFEALNQGPRSAEELAEALGVPARGLKLLADALVSLELLSRDDVGAYANRPVAQRFLVPGKGGYLGETILFNARSYAAWGRLSDAVRSGRPAIDPTHFLGTDPAATRNFVLAMHQRAQGVARCLAEMLDLQGRHRLLDLGGGPGTYSVLLAERFPELVSTVMDLPEVIAVARGLVAESSAADRIQLKPGDVFADPFGADYDVVLLSGILHRTEGAGSAAFLKRAANALKSGGLLAISDVFVGGEQAGPVMPELFSLHMMLTADRGQSVPLDGLAGLLADAGLQLHATRPFPPPLPHTLCLAVKA